MHIDWVDWLVIIGMRAMAVFNGEEYKGRGRRETAGRNKKPTIKMDLQFSRHLITFTDPTNHTQAVGVGETVKEEESFKRNQKSSFLIANNDPH